MRLTQAIWTYAGVRFLLLGAILAAVLVEFGRGARFLAKFHGPAAGPKRKQRGEQQDKNVTRLQRFTSRTICNPANGLRFTNHARRVNGKRSRDAIFGQSSRTRGDAQMQKTRRPKRRKHNSIAKIHFAVSFEFENGLRSTQKRPPCFETKIARRHFW